MFPINCSKVTNTHSAFADEGWTIEQFYNLVTNLRGSHISTTFFINGNLTPFPSKQCTEISASAIDKIEIHYHCRMPELKTTPMIEFTNCSKWYHIGCCQGIPKKCLDDSTVLWLCSSCKKKTFRLCYLYVKSLHFI